MSYVMATMTHDTMAELRATSRTRTGLGFAVISAASFGLSGSLGKGLLDAGWSPAAAVCFRILIAAAVLSIPAVRTMRGRWDVLIRNAPAVAAYGLVAVAGCQLAYFNAVAHMPVAIALLIEYAAPVAVIAWLWARHGSRPGQFTVLGAVVALGGLMLVLDLFSAGRVSPVGMVWALGAMAGAAAYFILSADDTGLPPLALAGFGLLVGGVTLAVLGLFGVLPFKVASAPVHFTGMTVPWFVPLLALGVVTAAIAYVTGIEASRLLGSRLASFVALMEVLFSMGYAILLLGQTPRLIQLAGAVCVLGGVVLVKLGEPAD